MKMVVVTAITICSLACMCRDLNGSVARLQHAVVPSGVTRLQRAVGVISAKKGVWAWEPGSSVAALPGLVVLLALAIPWWLLWLLCLWLSRYSCSPKLHLLDLEVVMLPLLLIPPLTWQHCG